MFWQASLDTVRSEICDAFDRVSVEARAGSKQELPGKLAFALVIEVEGTKVRCKCKRRFQGAGYAGSTSG
jgi:hypothetical protein